MFPFLFLNKTTLSAWPSLFGVDISGIFYIPNRSNPKWVFLIETD
jgi:hypothetical protein